MLVPKEEAELYFRLRMPYMTYMQKRLDIMPDTPVNKLPGEKIHQLGGEVADRPEYIDIYLKYWRPDLSDEKKAVIRGWKRVVRGPFVVMEYRKDGARFYDWQSGKVYKVLGLMSEIFELAHHKRQPYIAECRLIPLKDWIVTDMTLLSYPYKEEAGSLEELWESYRKAAKKGVVNTL